jgi:hypothetical protein
MYTYVHLTRIFTQYITFKLILLPEYPHFYIHIFHYLTL